MVEDQVPLLKKYFGQMIEKCGTYSAPSTIEESYSSLSNCDEHFYVAENAMSFEMKAILSLAQFIQSMNKAQVFGKVTL